MTTNKPAAAPVDPAAVWDSAKPQPSSAQGRHDDLPPISPLASSPAWQWGWKWWCGIHYGPIPVGMLIAIPLLIAMRS
jgi:hypothetical protein